MRRVSNALIGETRPHVKGHASSQALGKRSQSKNGHATMGKFIETKSIHVSGDEEDVEAVGRHIVAHKSWFPAQEPDFIVTFIAGNVHFDQWWRDDHRLALQAGLHKMMNTLDVVIFDDGLNYGVSKILGNVAHEEDVLRSRSAMASARNRSPLIGIVPSCRLQEFQRESEAAAKWETESLEKSERTSKQVLNRHHANHVFLDKQSYRKAGVSRAILEIAIREELCTRIPSGKDTKKSSGSVTGMKTKKGIPMVALLFQGELEDLDRIKAYVERGVPVVAMAGCGGLGDVIASALKDSADLSDTVLRSVIEKSLLKDFPQFTTNNAEGAEDVVEVILKLVRSAQGDQADFHHTIDCGTIDSFRNLTIPILESAIKSCTQVASEGLLSAYMTLAVKCNQPEVADKLLLSKAPWSSMPLPHPAFELALILQDRERFIDLYLSQQFPLWSYLSHLKLLKLFRTRLDPDNDQFFTEFVWQGIMRYSSLLPIARDFVEVDLNNLIAKLTGVRDYIDLHTLSAASFGGRQSGILIDPVMAERKAMNALLVVAVLFNRPILADILIKYSVQPLLQALMAEALFHGLFKNVEHVATADLLLKTSEKFAKTAVQLLDLAVKDSPARAKGFLHSKFPDFNHKTPMEIAYDINNREFIGHSVVQDWLDEVYHNNIKVKGDMDTVKLFLSAILIFPMYLWLSFPKLQAVKLLITQDDEDKLGTFCYHPKNADDKAKILAHMHEVQILGIDHPDYKTSKPTFPPFTQMVRAVWAAPIIRFFTWHVFYWMFIALICVAIMLPPCRFIGVDIALFALSASICLELIARTIYDHQRNRRVVWFDRYFDLFCQIAFNILFFLSRIAPMRYSHPYAGRVILTFGATYYCSRVWVWFYYMDKTMGPTIRIVRQMFSISLPRWCLLVTPMLIANAVIHLGVFNPDLPIHGDEWRRVVYNGMFSGLFGGNGDLEYTSDCEANRVNPSKVYAPFWSQPGSNPPDRCWSGNYNDPKCPTISVWSYFFNIQYYVFLTLGLQSMLGAIYFQRFGTWQTDGPGVWKFNRCRIILDYAGRSSLPPPFYSLSYFYMMIEHLFKSGKTITGNRLGAGKEDEGIQSTYWKGLAIDYFHRKEEEQHINALAQEHLKEITDINDSVSLLCTKLHVAAKHRTFVC